MGDLGLKHDVNVLVDYDPDWEAAFRKEKERLETVLPAGIARGIEHYGSTAVPGLRAKPILDILVAVAPLSDWETCRGPLESLGYDYAAHAGVPGHYIFGRGKDTTERSHLVHVVEYQSRSWARNLAFRDALRSDPTLRQAYVLEKEAAVAAAPIGRAKYNDVKATFIVRIQEQLTARDQERLRGRRPRSG